MTSVVQIPGLGPMSKRSGIHMLNVCSDGVHRVGVNGVVSIVATGDHKVEFVAFESHTLAYVRSAMGFPAYYPVHPVHLKKPVRAVLMDLDGTTVRSEPFWVWIIQSCVASLLDDPTFELSEDDSPFVAGHSVSEHLQYAINKYCPDKSLADARHYYFEHTRRELQAIVEGHGRRDAFLPAPGVQEFLQELKKRNIKIGLVTSGLYEKAWPAIVSAFRTMGLGDPSAFYDTIITAGFPLGAGAPGTLGELSPKPHPWLYAEAFRVGLGIEFENRNSVLAIEDSGAGVCSARIAGFPTIGITGGNIIESGTEDLCTYSAKTFDEILSIMI
ncbi:MAG: HAD family phosphatase [Phycisphaerae bacterium]|nr:HAD family phosphatase [Phycisphaerales bacterium]